MFFRKQMSLVCFQLKKQALMRRTHSRTINRITKTITRGTMKGTIRGLTMFRDPMFRDRALRLMVHARDLNEGPVVGFVFHAKTRAPS